jgi:hypothetical protein
MERSPRTGGGRASPCTTRVRRRRPAG